MTKRILTQLCIGLIALNITVPAFAGLKTKAATTGVAGTILYLTYRGAKEVAKDVAPSIKKIQEIPGNVKTDIKIRISNAKFHMNEMKDKIVRKTKNKAIRGVNKVIRGAKVAAKLGVASALLYNHDTSAALGTAIRQGVATTGETLVAVTKPIIQETTAIAGSAITKITPVILQSLGRNLVEFSQFNLKKPFVAQPIYAGITTLAGLYLASRVWYKYETTNYKEHFLTKWNSLKQRANSVASYVKIPATVVGTCVGLSYLYDVVP